MKHLEFLASHPESECQVLVPTITDPRGLDLVLVQRTWPAGALRGKRATHYQCLAGNGGTDD